MAVGILGAVIMPHNIYLHSALVQSRRVQLRLRGGSMLIFYESYSCGTSGHDCMCVTEGAGNNCLASINAAPCVKLPCTRSAA